MKLEVEWPIDGVGGTLKNLVFTALESEKI